MTRGRMTAALVLTTLAYAACSPTTDGDNAAAAAASAATDVNVDLEAIAQGVVERANVQPGEVVLLTGLERDREFIENMAIHVLRRGGDPLPLVGSERMARRSYDDVPASMDTLPQRWNDAIAEVADVVIAVDNVETPDLLAHVPPERLAVRSAAGATAYERLRERGARTVDVGNGLYPTASTAERFDLTQAELARVFWSGLETDPASLHAAGDPFRVALDGGRTVRITSAAGTDLTFRLAGTPARINDGGFDDAEVASGTFQNTYVPAGEVYSAAEPGSANGTVMVPAIRFRGSEFTDVRITFVDGQVTDIQGPAGIEAYRATMDAEGEAAKALGGVDLGINTGIPPGKVHTWVAPGMVTVWTGNNVWAGGENASPTVYSFFLPGATLTVDDRVLVENGELKN